MSRKQRRRRNQQGQSKVAEYEAATALLQEEQAARKMDLIESEIARVRGLRAVERMTIGGSVFVDPMDYSMAPGYGNLLSTYGGSVVSSNREDRREGRNEPFVRTEQDLADIRGLARYVTTLNCAGVGIMENLENYVVERGFTYSANTKKGVESPEGLVEEVQEVINEFDADNDFTGDLDRELYGRDHRDGEFFLALYPTKIGGTKARVIEPEQIIDPGEMVLSEQEILDRYKVFIDCASNTTFGVHTADHDVQTVYGYCVEWESDGDFDYIPERYLEHSKFNVDRNIKRGLSSFYPAWDWLLQQQRLLKNTGEGAAELAAIAYIVQHATGTSKGEVENMRHSMAQVVTQTSTSYGTQTKYHSRRSPGEKLDVPKGQEYKAGPAGHERGNAFLEVVQGILRQVGTRFAMTEGMISGDDSNNNLASAVEAGSRFHKFALTQQSTISKQFERIIWKVVQNAYDADRFREFGFSKTNGAEGSWSRLKRLIEVDIECPDIDVKKGLDVAQERAVLFTNKIMSRKTWQEKSNLDSDQEEENFRMEAEEAQQAAQQQGMLGIGSALGTPQAEPGGAVGQDVQPGQGSPAQPASSDKGGSGNEDLEAKIKSAITEAATQAASKVLEMAGAVSPGNLPVATRPDGLHEPRAKRKACECGPECDCEPCKKERGEGSVEEGESGKEASAADAAASNCVAPTEAQAAAGNYQKGHFRWNGLEISIETPKGSKRRPEWPEMTAHYGDIKRTDGSDGDNLDVFIGDNLDSDLVFIVDQVNKQGGFDEHKAMLGYGSKQQAVDAYKSNYTDDWKVGPVTAMNVDNFKTWLKGDTTKPVNGKAFEASDCGANAKGGGGFRKGNTCAKGSKNKLTDSPKFKKWFGRSKVVDEDGNPLRVYHGTFKGIEDGEFLRGSNNSLLGAGVYFTDDPEETAKYATTNISDPSKPTNHDLVAKAENLADYLGISYGEAKKELTRDAASQVLPVYLSIQDPLEIGHDELKFDKDKFLLAAKEIDFEGDAEQLYRNFHNRSSEDLWRLRKNNPDKSIGQLQWDLMRQDNATQMYGRLATMDRHDGIILHKDFTPLSDGTHYVTLYGGQIKSATGNSGEFSHDSDKITESAHQDFAVEHLDDDEHDQKKHGNRKSKVISPPYRVRGTTDDKTECEHCGKQHLRKTVGLERLDAEGNGTGDIIYCGTTCASKLMKSKGVNVSSGEIQKLADEADYIAKMDREDLERRKKSRIATDKGRANLSFNLTNSPLKGSFFMSKGDHWVRVRPGHPNEDKFIEWLKSEGFKQSGKAIEHSPGGHSHNQKNHGNRLSPGSRAKLKDALHKDDPGQSAKLAEDLRKKFDDEFDWLGESPYTGGPGTEGRKALENQKKAIKLIFENMPQNALASASRSIRFVEVHLSPDEVKWSLPARSQKQVGEGVVLGYWDSEKRKLVLDGGDHRMDSIGVYLHEMTHAIDDDLKISDTNRWKSAWEAEIDKDSNPLSRYARTDASEGLAEFGRLAFRRPEEAKKFKRCWAALSATGILE